MTFRRTVQIAKTTITLTVLIAAPSILMAQPAPFEVDADARTGYVAAWTPAMAKQFPACQPIVEGDVAAAVVVILPTGDVRRMSTDTAYALNTDDERANNVWVVGVC